MPRPSPPLSTTTEVMIVCRAKAPKLFAPKTRAYLSIDRSAAIWYLIISIVYLNALFPCASFNKIGQNNGETTPFLHGYCYQQHVQALENDITTVADPDVAGEGHEEECCCPKSRETTQGQLSPLVPSHLREAYTVRCCCTCEHIDLGLL